MRYEYTPLDTEYWPSLKNLGIEYAIRDAVNERTVAVCWNETWARLIVKSLNVYEGMRYIREFFKQVSDWEK